MRAIRMHDYGGPEVLRLDEVPVPEPAAGQVRSSRPCDWGESVRVEISRRPHAWPHRRHPAIHPGYDAAGTITDVGAACRAGKSVMQ